MVHRYSDLTIDEVVDEICRINYELATNWKCVWGWAPPEAARLLDESRLDWLVSLSHTLRLWIVQEIPDEQLDGRLILAWANLGALVEGSMKFFLSVYASNYTDAVTSKNTQSVFMKLWDRCAMLFIHPMWDNESERIGKQRCTPTGYALHVFADLLGFIGLLVLLAAPFFFAWRWLGGTFRTYDLWLLAAPIAIGIVSEAIYRYSWRLALRRGFSYNPERREASWLEAGERRTYRFADDTGTDDAT